MPVPAPSRLYSALDRPPISTSLCTARVADGVYRTTAGVPVFQGVRAPTTEQLQALLTRIIKRLLRLLTRRGYLIEEQGMTYLGDTDPEAALAPLQQVACTYRI